MKKRNYKEFFTLNSFLVLAMILFGTFKLGFLGGICASAVVCFFMLKSDAVGVVVSALITFLTDAMVNFAFNYTAITVMIFCALFINLALRGKKNLLYTVAYGVGGILAAFAVTIAFSQAFDVVGMRLGDIREYCENIRQFLESIFYFIGSAYTEYDINTVGNQLDAIVDVFYMSMIPAVVIAVSCVYSYLTVAVLKKIEKKLKYDVCDYLTDFTKIKADKMCIAVLLISFFGYALALTDYIQISAAMFCILILIVIFYGVCGISVFAYFAKNAKGIKKIFMYILMIAGIFLFDFAIFIIGIIDSFADIRKVSERR